jgi:L-fuconate dehydratase
MTDVLTPEEALEMLRRKLPSRGEREGEVRRNGYPAYSTAAGWLGYPDEKVRSICRQLVSDGWNHIKLKVGVNLADDERRAAIVREEIGPHRKLMVDANQVWEVPEAIAWIQRLARFDPWWVEEPTSPDDILGHRKIAQAVAPIRIATGEHMQNRILFKQFLEAEALQVCQLDSCRLAGVNEVIAVLLLAAKFGVPVCPHAGGVGLCEYVQHVSIFDYICVSGSLEGRVVEYVDQLHEHFIDPVVIKNAHYMPPTAPGYSIAMHPQSLARFTYPTGPEWAEHEGSGSSSASV